MKAYSLSLLAMMLTALMGCTDFSLEEEAFCERNPAWCGSCGNGIMQPGEACDDGNLQDGDGCNRACASEETCGNDFRDPNEACDDGNLDDGDGCNHSCTSNEACGNGIKDPQEACDDGNPISGDGCSADCRSTEFCGNGYRDTSKGEECDDGNNVDGDQCAADCRVASQGCGNGRVEPPELCDDGDASNDNGCLANCIPAQCGDGIVSPQASYPEECDPGHPDTDTATCTRTCRISTCGDRYINIQAGEQCEDGNRDNCGTCNSTCKIRHAPSLASGFINAAAASAFLEGETFTLNDGLHAPVLFEFSNDAQIPGRVRIPRQGSAADMARAIMGAIMGAPGCDIDASLDPRPEENDRVLLRHRYPTSLGNRAITETVRDGNFFVQGMAGGAAGDCPPTMGCTVNEDCMPGLRCQGGICTQ